MSTIELERETSVSGVDPMLPEWYTVQRVRRENHDTFTLELCACDGETAFAFQPGQFNMLYVHGVGEIPISISGDPERRDLVTHTTRAVGTVTRAMWHLKRGDSLGLRGPFGTAWPVEEARGRDVVIVAGGIGLAPLRPVLYSIIHDRESFGNVVLLYGARTPDDRLFVDEVLTMAAISRVQVDETVDRAVTGWAGKIGVVTSLIPRAGFDADEAIALVCGPEVMMRFTIEALRHRGMDTRQIYVSMERNMKCAVGFCGHCQYGPTFICKDGPVFRYDKIEHLFGIREL